MTKYLKNTLRQKRVSYWDKITLGCLAIDYRRNGIRGVNICYRMPSLRYCIRGSKHVKIYRNVTGYPVCDSFLFKATPLFGYEYE